MNEMSIIWAALEYLATGINWTCERGRDAWSWVGMRAADVTLYCGLRREGATHAATVALIRAAKANIEAVQNIVNGAVSRMCEPKEEQSVLVVQIPKEMPQA